MLTTIKAILTKFEILKKFAEIIKSAFSTVSVYASKKRYPSTDHLVNDFYADKVTYGEQIEVKGFFSQFSQILIPESYLYIVPDRTTLTEPIIEPDGRVKHGSKFQYTNLQVPISVFPKEPSTGHMLGFLYPQEFSGFKLSNQKRENLCRDKKARVPFLFPDSHQPIPVIFNPNKHSKFLENFVTLHCTIAKTPKDVVKEISCLELGYVLSKSYNFQSIKNTTLALSLASDSSTITLENQTILEPYFLLYFEFFLVIENPSINPMLIINKSLPDSFGIKECNMEPHKEFHLFLTLGDTRVIGREPNIFALYSEVKGIKSFRRSIRNVQRYFNLLSWNIQKLLKNEKYKIVPGFSTKPEYQYLFSTNGAFTHEEIAKELRMHMNIVEQYNPKFKFI